MTQSRLRPVPLLLTVFALHLSAGQNPLHAQDQYDVMVSRNPHVKPIPDRAIVGTMVSSFGDSRLEWRAYSPEGRARLIQALAGQPRHIAVRAWNGLGDPTSDDATAEYSADQVRIEAVDAARWWFEFSNTGTNARRARWQLARLPYAGVGNWRLPAGLIAQGEILPLNSGSTPSRFVVDFGSFLPGGQPSPDDSPVAVALSSMLHPEYPTGTLYLRALGLGRNGAPVSLPSEAVRIDLAPLRVGGPLADQSVLPRVQFVGYRPLRPTAADARCWVRPTRSLILTPGAEDSAAEDHAADTDLQLSPLDAINLCDAANQDALLVYASIVSSSAMLADELRQWGAQKLELAKEAIRTQTQQRYGGVTAACAGQCRQALGLAADQVMAIAGIPHSVSGEMQLEQIRTYLERMLVHAFRQHSGMGDAFESKAAAEAADVLLAMLASRDEPLPPAFEPLHEKQQRSPQLTLRIGAGAEATSHRWLQVRELNSKPRLHPLLVPVPPLEAGQQMELPIELTSTEVPDPNELMLPPLANLTSGLGSAAELLQRIATQLNGLDQALSKAYAPALKGRYRIELAWRDAQGGLQPIGVATCDTGRDRCRFKG